MKIYSVIKNSVIQIARFAFVILAILAILFAVSPAMASNGAAPGQDAGPITVDLTTESLIVIGAALLSLGFKYIPGLNTWYAAQSEQVERLLMAGLILVVMVVVFVGTCYGFMTSNLTCSNQGVVNALFIYILAIAANQGTHGIAGDPTGVKLIKLTKKTIATNKLLGDPAPTTPYPADTPEPVSAAIPTKKIERSKKS